MTHNKIDHSLAAPHDSGYKGLLSQRQICVDLVQSCIDADWAKEIDVSYVNDKTNEFILPEFRLKKADKVFEMKIMDKDVYFYILQELQSTVDFHMPYRLLTYMIEIWRQIIANNEELAYRKNYRLPIIIPIVLYNGRYNWTAPTNFKQMLDYGEYFESLLPDFPYILIDVNRYSKNFLKNLSNTIGAIFLLDQTYDIIELADRLQDALPGIKTFELAGFQIFKNWFKYIISDQLPPEERKIFLKILEQASPKEANLMISNLSETIRKAQETAEQKGIKQGIERGIERGIEIVAKNMLRQNIPFEAIIAVTELPLIEIKKLAKEIKLEQA